MTSLTDRLAAATGNPADPGRPQGPPPPPPRRTAGGTDAAAAQPATGGRRRAESDRYDELKASVHNELLVQLGPQLYDANLSQSELEAKVRTALIDVMAAESRPLTAADRQRITQEIADDILGYGPLEPYLRDPDVAEVMVNGPFDIWLERRGKLERVEGKFKDEAHLRRTIDKIVSRIGRRVDEAAPMVDARLPDGSRVNAVIPPLALDGSTLTIRKFAADPFTVEDLIQFGSFSRQTADFLEACVRARLNVVVSGGTGAGKTTTLNVLSSFIPGDERIVTIEDAAELQLKQDHVVRLESRPANIEGKGQVSIRDLVRNSLRMRPDRIIVGEVRDASALDMLQAMNTGHDGSICTVHSNGPRDTLSRIETMVLMAGMDLPIRAIREQIASAVDLIVHQARLKDGSRRITHVTEVERMEGDVITLQDVFVFDNSAGFDEDGRALGSLQATGLRPKFVEKMAYANVHVDPRTFARQAL
jgi:pilus assembly protein CpaF